ncbi:hypothetical protein CPC08DRAFT_719037 [Agrocybe pediades]|nr:hypothetical protein CPC08DRAFT_719037 [Agrocybe pediades]
MITPDFQSLFKYVSHVHGSLSSSDFGVGPYQLPEPNPEASSLPAMRRAHACRNFVSSSGYLDRNLFNSTHGQWATHLRILCTINRATLLTIRAIFKPRKRYRCIVHDMTEKSGVSPWDSFHVLWIISMDVRVWAAPMPNPNAIIPFIGTGTATDSSLLSDENDIAAAGEAGSGGEQRISATDTRFDVDVDPTRR